MKLWAKLKRWYLLKTTVPIRYSDDSTLAYIDDNRALHGFWLEVVAKPGPVPEDHKESLFDAAMQTKQNDGTTAWRRVYPFAWWKIHSRDGKRGRLPWGSDFVQDWLVYRAERP